MQALSTLSLESTELPVRKLQPALQTPLLIHRPSALYVLSAWTHWKRCCCLKPMMARPFPTPSSIKEAYAGTANLCVISTFFGSRAARSVQGGSSKVVSRFIASHSIVPNGGYPGSPRGYDGSVTRGMKPRNQRSNSDSQSNKATPSDRSFRPCGIAPAWSQYSGGWGLWLVAISMEEIVRAVGPLG